MKPYAFLRMRAFLPHFNLDRVTVQHPRRPWKKVPSIHESQELRLWGSKDIQVRSCWL